MAYYNFQRMSDDQLKRSYRFHSRDNGTTTMEEECRRMYIMQETSAELQRRGVPLKEFE